MNHVNPETIARIKSDTQRAKDDSRARKILTQFYPFDTVASYMIKREHLAVFMGYIPVAKIDLDDVVFARHYIKNSSV